MSVRKSSEPIDKSLDQIGICYFFASATLFDYAMEFRGNFHCVNAEIPELITDHGVRLEDCLYMTEDGPAWFTVPPDSLDAPIGRMG